MWTACSPSSLVRALLWCDAAMQWRTGTGTTIGMSQIKERRLRELTLASHPGLHVGECVPFYFCPRSVMLYLIYMRNHPELSFSDGQGPVVHLEADLRETVTWATANGRRWAFTTSNAGAYYFEDYSDLAELGRIDWEAVNATDWRQCKDGKQAEFLIEDSFPWELVTGVGVHSAPVRDKVHDALRVAIHQPRVEVKRDWYY